jgi:cytochrome P450
MTATEKLTYPFDRPSVLGLSNTYAHIRDNAGVALISLPSGDLAYLVTRYDDVKTVLSDNRFSRAATLKPGAPRVGPAPQRFPTLLNMDPPHHSSVRKIISREFTARRVEALKPKIHEHTDRLIDDMMRSGPPADLFTSVASLLPVTIICELLGVPMEDRAQFGAWSRAFLVTTSKDYTKQQVMEAQINLRNYLAGLVFMKRVEPGGDLLSALVLAHDNDRRMTEEELLFLGITLLVAGHETTVNAITNGILALLLHPEQMARLRADLSLVPVAVEDILRLFGPGTDALLRIAMEDVELSGVTIPAGSAVLPGLGAANRDPEHFADADTFSVERGDTSHFTFGHGPHFCIGSALARAELQICFTALIERMPNMRLAIDVADIQRPAGLLVNGVSSLPLAW